MYCEKLDILLNYRKSSIKPPKGLFLLIRFYEGFNREGGGGANLICGETGYHTAFQTKRQWAKKIVSDSYSYSLGQVDFAIGLVNSVLNFFFFFFFFFFLTIFIVLTNIMLTYLHSTYLHKALIPTYI